MEANGTLTKTLSEPCKTNLEQADSYPYDLVEADNCLTCPLSCSQYEVMTARQIGMDHGSEYEKEQGVETIPSLPDQSAASLT